MPTPSSATSMTKSSPTVMVNSSGRECRTPFADRLAENGFGVLGDQGWDAIQLTGHPDRGAQRCIGGQLGDHRVQAGTQLCRPGRVGREIVDRGTDVDDDLLKMVHVVGDPRGHLG